MRTGAVIVAAGMSSRMGDFKPMLQIGSISIAERIIINFQRADVFPIVVVTGYRAQELEKHLSRLDVVCVRNPDYQQTEMFDSAKIGFSFIGRQCERTFFTPVDIPLFTYHTVERLMVSRAKVAKPVCNGVDGHPILISCSLLPEIGRCGKEMGLKKAIADCCADIDLIAVDDEGILHDADTPQEYRDLVCQHNRQLFRPVIDVSLMREGKLFDKNGAILLRMIQYSGTVKDACERVGISYSKAWKLISELEENLGFPLIERQPGGEYGGGSRLTDAGKDLLKNYMEYTDAVKKYANGAFEPYFERKPCEHETAGDLGCGTDGQSGPPVHKRK